MPGIAGFTSNSQRISDNVLLDKMCNSICNFDYHDSDKKNISNLYNGIVAFEFDKDFRQYENDDLYICIYGDVIVDKSIGVSARKTLFKNIIGNFPNISFFKDIDGLFNVLVYDKDKDDIYIIIDRNGLSHLYYGVIGNQLYWSSELRSFLLIDKKLTLNKDSIHSYLVLGYLLQDETWFNEIRLQSPSTYLKWNSKRNELTMQKYWYCRDSLGNTNRADYKTIVTDLIDLFKDAVSKRYTEHERVGITLSGGLDSRAIFAAVNNRRNLPVVTRGQKKCQDIRIAKKVVAQKRSVNHMVVDMNKDNWLDGRIEAVKITTGQKNLIHMNALSSLPLHKKLFDINLDGAGGDGILRGKHIIQSRNGKIRQYLSKYIYDNYIFSEEVLDRLVSYYNKINSPECFYIQQRVRRFIIFGSILGHDHGIMSRFPFLDHAVQDYLVRLPPTIDRNALYSKMLKEAFPEYFNHKISFDLKSEINNIKLIRKIRNRVAYLSGNGILSIQSHNNNYHDYNNWLRTGPGLKLIQNVIINNKESALKYFISHTYMKEKFDQQLRGAKNAECISRFLTLELTLQNVKNQIDM